MKTKSILVAFAFGCACCVSFFLGKTSTKTEPDKVPPTTSDGSAAESIPTTAPPKPESRVESDEDAIRIAREALIEVWSNDLEESVVLTSGRYKLVSFRIWSNPHDPRPKRPDKWHSPVWIDVETGAVVPPQMPDWKPMSNSEIKAFLTEWSPSLKRAQNWTWSIDHVSGFARVRIRDTVSSPPDPMEEDGKPAAFEYWVDETRKAEVCAYEL